MASSGTLLSDLGGSGGDEDLVKRIFADMNGGGGGGNQMIRSPNPNSTAPMAMDSAPQTSHVIGKDHPTPGDFAAAMHQASRVQQNYPMPPPQGTGGQEHGQWGAPYQQPQVPQPVMEAPKKNMYAKVAEEAKIPVFVSLLVFVFSLPFLNILFQHYIPSLVKPTGDLTTLGLLAKSVMAGATFWVLQRIVAPLISL
jgi:hypothetical protein